MGNTISGGMENKIGNIAKIVKTEPISNPGTQKSTTEEVGKVAESTAQEVVETSSKATKLNTSA